MVDCPARGQHVLKLAAALALPGHMSGGAFLLWNNSEVQIMFADLRRSRIDRR